MQSHFSPRTRQRAQEQHDNHNLNPGVNMAGVATLYLLLLLPLCTLQSEGQINPHQAPAAPLPPPQLRDLFAQEQTPQLNTKPTSSKVDQDNVKVGLFIAASIGTFALMAAVYCIYNKFYSKQQYLHTQLNEDPDFPSDHVDPPPVFFHGSTFSSVADVRKAGYGSVSDAPSIISLPPSLSPPPSSSMPFPPPFLSSQSLRTISARDLQRSCI